MGLSYPFVEINVTDVFSMCYVFIMVFLVEEDMWKEEDIYQLYCNLIMAQSWL